MHNSKPLLISNGCKVLRQMCLPGEEYIESGYMYVEVHNGKHNRVKGIGYARRVRTLCVHVFG